MLEQFTITPTPDKQADRVPQHAVTSDMIINKPIPPFAILGTLAQQDNFGEIKVMRYDAKYHSTSGLEVLVYVFDFNTRAELEQALHTQFEVVLQGGLKTEAGQPMGMFTDGHKHAIAFWTHDKLLVYVDTFGPGGNKQVIDRYLEKYSSDLPHE